MTVVVGVISEQDCQMQACETTVRHLNWKPIVSHARNLSDVSVTMEYIMPYLIHSCTWI